MNYLVLPIRIKLLYGKTAYIVLLYINFMKFIEAKIAQSKNKNYIYV